MSGVMSSFLKLEGDCVLQGGATDPTHSGWFNLDGYGFLEPSRRQGQTPNNGLRPIGLILPFDTASSHLVSAAALNGRFRQAVIHATRNREGRSSIIFEIKMKNVALRNVASSDSNFHATLVYDACEVVYYQFDPTTGGSAPGVTPGYNLKQMQKV